MNEIKLAILFTCFNRKEKTVACIKSIMKQKNMPAYEFFICDDASTDGTAEEILKIAPNANIISGTGSLFWNRGMHKALAAAMKKDFDYYLMINDDVGFFDSMWETMYLPFKNGAKRLGVVGYTEDAAAHNITYGGYKFVRKRLNWYISERVPMSTDEQHWTECDLANWNCFLIDAHVIKEIGNLDYKYQHSLGDFDYCLCMREAGIPIVTSTRTVGYCSNNSRNNTYLDSSLPRKERLKKLKSPNGFPSGPWMHFVAKHYRGIPKLRAMFMPIIKDYWAIIRGKDIV